MKWFLMVVLSWFVSPVAHAAKDEPVYAGGMMFMGSFISMPETSPDLKGVALGVGGRLVFMTGTGFRVGILGGTGKMTYGKHESHFQYNHSALSAEWGLTHHRLSLTLGISGGWAKYYILDKHSVSPDGLITAREYQKSVPIFSPFFSIEFSLSGRLRATIFVDFANMPVEDHQHGGVRIGAGILFVK